MINTLCLVAGLILGRISKPNKDTLFNVIESNYRNYFCDKDDLYFYVSDGCITKNQYMFITGEKYPEQPQA